MVKCNCNNNGNLIFYLFKEVFLAAERTKLNDPKTDVTTVRQMIHYGIPYGNGLLQREKEAATAAIQAGLTTNRYTTCSLPDQEQRWKRLMEDEQARLISLQNPPKTVLPAIPFNANFQPFHFAKPADKEPMLLLDVTASMNAPISVKKSTARLKVVEEVIRLLVEQISYAFSNNPKKKKGSGLRTITFAGGTSEDINELTPTNFFNRWNKIKWEGNTRIMAGWRALNQVFLKEYGRLPLDQRPVMLALVVTDGDALDIEEFEQSLQSDQNAYVVIAIVGYGEDHDRALNQFNLISKANPRLKVIPLLGTDDAQLIAGTLLSMINSSK